VTNRTIDEKPQIIIEHQRYLLHFIEMATLAVKAAGIGSRYGGLKQLDPVDPSGEVILDDSVYDALATGFDRVVFVVRREFEEEFRRVVAVGYAVSTQVELAFQDSDDLPPGFDRPVAREKSWGTVEKCASIERNGAGGRFRGRIRELLGIYTGYLRRTGAAHSRILLRPTDNRRNLSYPSPENLKNDSNHNLA
jgi:hypothetical protein